MSEPIAYEKILAFACIEEKNHFSGNKSKAQLF